jgi:hypothetical protein
MGSPLLGDRNKLIRSGSVSELTREVESERNASPQEVEGSDDNDYRSGGKVLRK